jgi:hypothetical protein
LIAQKLSFQLIAVSGVFGQSEEIDTLVRRQCNTQAAVRNGGTKFNGVVGHNHCSGPIEKLFSCCFCYGEYPDFILEETGQWSKHVELLGFKESHTKDKQYWFCAEPRRAVLNKTNAMISLAQGTNVVVVTGKFGHGDGFQSQIEDFCNKIKAASFVRYEHIYCMYQSPDFVLRDNRFNRHLRYHQEPNDVSSRGGGYWVHKSLLVRHHMDQCKDNDIIFWVDADRLDFFWQGSLKTVLETIDKREADFVIESQDEAEYRYTKEDVLVAFNATDEMRTSRQVNENAWLIRNSPKMRQFMDAFIECAADWHMISDDPSIIKNHPDFVEHRHDQSLMAMMVKKFLSDKLVIGPPAQPYQLGFAVYHTYKLLDGRSVKNESTINQPYCPFPSFYHMYPNATKDSS